MDQDGTKSVFSNGASLLNFRLKILVIKLSAKLSGLSVSLAVLIKVFLLTVIKVFSKSRDLLFYIWQSLLYLGIHAGLFHISIYKLSDLGHLSNLIGSLSRTLQQYSPPSEWIMCELGFFPIFLEKDLLKVDKILGLTFFQARKDFEGFKTAFFHLLLLSFVVDGLFTTPVYSPRRGRFVNSAFPNKKNLAPKRGLLMTNKFESKCLQKFYVSSK